MRELKKAANYIKMHDAVAPPDAYNLFLQGEMHRKMRQLDIAIAKNMEALEIKPDFKFSLDRLCKFYALKEEYEKSLRWANEYVSRAFSAGQKAAAYARRGFYLYWRGNFKEAISSFILAEEMEEEVENWGMKSAAVEWKGISCVALSELDLSRKSFEDDVRIAEEHFPTDVPLYKAYAAWWMGNLAIKQGRIDQANTRLSEMKSFLPIVGEGWKAFVILWHDLLQGEVFLAQGSLDTALSVSQKACQPGSSFQEDSMYYMDLWPGFTLREERSARPLRNTNVCSSRMSAPM